MMTDYWVNWWAVGKFYGQDSNWNIIIFAILVAASVYIGTETDCIY